MAHLLWFIIFSSCILFSCTSPNDAYEEYANGTISYPFYNQARPIGKNGKFNNDRFVIRTISGSTEHVIEIPGAATEYNVEVPIASQTSQEKKYRIKNAQLTDRELVAGMPKLTGATQAERALMDRAFGVGEKGGPKQSPSYSLGISKINGLYRNAKYELALVETNNLLQYYPTSVKLYKMKGSIYIKLSNYHLAEKAWSRAGNLAPTDPVIKKGLTRLKKKIQNAEELAKKLEAPAPTAH